MEVVKNIKYFKLYISQFFFFLCIIKGQSYNDLSIDLDQAYFNLNELNFETNISADSLNNGKLKINSFQFGFDKINFDNIKDKSIEVWTKSDISIHENKDIIISTKKDQGITQLIDIIGKFVEKGCRTEGSFITRSRHRDALEKTKNHLSMIAKNDLLDVEVIVEELRSAVNSLARITGHVDVEDLLDIIFKDFCIGK